MTGPRPIAGARAVVLGATGGLGHELAAGLAARGADVVLIGRDPVALDALAVEGSRVTADLRSPDAVEAALAAAAENGPLDVVVNAVGVVAFGTIDELSVDAMEELFLVNAFLPLLLGRFALPRMAEGGVLVSIAGVIAEQNLPGMVAYGASKAAARAASEGLAREGRRRKVRVLDARPPHTETGLAGRAIEGTAPRMPEGLDPAAVAHRILAAIEAGETDLPSREFS